MIRPLLLLIAVIAVVLGIRAARSPSSEDQARAVFDSFQSRERTFDPAMADLYCETAVIRHTQTDLASGEQHTVDFPAPQYKDLIRQLTPVAKELGEYSTFSAVSYIPEAEHVRVTATRYSERKHYSSPISLVIGPCKDGAWAILDEISESQR